MSRLSTRTALLVISIAAGSLSACGGGGFQAASSTAGNQTKAAPVPAPGPTNDELKICSNLSLKGVTWPETLTFAQKRSLALALNISGSFEGSVGWKNITNNFDGQGLSLGLLNQCLGQGSLQPLLAKMRDRSRSQLVEILGPAHSASLLGMIARWESAQKATSLALVDGESLEELMPDGRASWMDVLPDGSDGIGHQESASGDSVTWAKQTLYTDGGSTFVVAWKRELQAVSADPRYVSIQIEAALKDHARALGYMKALGFKELRSYLTMFDIVVQNGSLYAEDISEYLAALPLSAAVDETTRLKKILALRLRHVVSKYRSDVEARKLSIINGKGVVHQSSRDYEKEYCFTGRDLF